MSCLSIKNFLITLYLKACYKLALYRVRVLAKNHKPIIVFFFVSEIAKWKAQSLYDLFKLDDRFSPTICVYPMAKETSIDKSQLCAILSEKKSFFFNKGMKVINIWDVQKGEVDMSYFSSSMGGIIFYQQPWDVPPAPTPLQVASRYLTFYIPYYLVNYYDKHLELCQKLHKRVFRYIVPSDDIKKAYLQDVNKYEYSGKIVGLGHPCIDNLLSSKRSCKQFTAIYAPHFSFPCDTVKRPLYYSTFLDNGEYILDYAKKHSDIRWIFKPHPRLRSELEETGVWTPNHIKQYYEEWERLGDVCYTSDYQTLFVNSDVMLTDSGSFLTEYACTGNPIVWLVPSRQSLLPNPILNDLYSTYYKVDNNSELADILNLLIVNRQDFQKTERHKALGKLGLLDRSAERIFQNILSLLYI